MCIPASRAFSNFISEPRHFPLMMNSNIILRRFAACSAVRHRSLTSTNILRLYSTPSEEPDPQLDGYPQLPWQSRQDLPPLGWQDNLMRRNYGDTVRLSRLEIFFLLISLIASRTRRGLVYVGPRPSSSPN